MANGETTETSGTGNPEDRDQVWSRALESQTSLEGLANVVVLSVGDLQVHQKVLKAAIKRVEELSLTLEGKTPEDSLKEIVDKIDRKLRRSE